MNDLHEVSFSWPDTRPRDVILTGSFDQWARSIHLSKSPNGFEGKVKVPWEARIPYKFIVDGNWMTLQSQPKENDGHGNINNIYVSPPKPEVIVPVDEATIEPTVSKDIPNANATLTSPSINAIPATTGQNDLETDNTPKESVVPSQSKPVSAVESTNSDDFLAVSPNVLPLNGPLSTAAVEPTVPSEAVESIKSGDLPAVSPNVLSLNDPTTTVEPAVPSGAGKPTAPVTPDPAVPPSIEFPKSEASDAQKSTEMPVMNHTSDSNTNSPQPKTEKDTSSEPIENEPRVVPPSPAPSSRSSFLGGHLRGGSETRQRSVSSRSGSVRSESQRPKRHSLLGKVKHLFHLDKDS